MTLHIFHSINIIKQIKERPEIFDEQFVEFKFTKPGFKKLLIFDLDETLIHSLIEREDLITDINNDQEVGGETPDNNNVLPSYNFNPDIWIDLIDPEDSNHKVQKHGFSIRPYALDCLKQAN